jgi:hypothetical protein
MSNLALIGAGKAAFGSAYESKVKNTQAASLEVYWRANGNGDDASGNGHSATVSGAGYNSSGVEGSDQWDFDGINDYVEADSGLLSALDSANVGTQGTIMLWVTAPSWPGGGEHLFRLDGGANHNVRAFTNTSGDLRCQLNSNGTVKNITISSASTSQFMLTFTWDEGADEYKIYVDDNQNGSTATGLGTWANSFSYLVLGAENNTPDDPLASRIDEFAIWSVALSEAEIDAIYAEA